MNQINFFLLLCSIISFFTKDIHAQLTTPINQLLDTKQQSIVSISAFTAKGDLAQLHQALNDGLDTGLTINEIKEVLVQLYAYAGFPRSLNAISTFETVVNERQKNGIKDQEGKAPDKQTFENGRFPYGKDVQTKLTGTTDIGSAQKFVPVIDTFLKEHLFADIFSRDNLDYPSREIATVSALASLSGTEPQLRSHLNVCKNIGLTEKQLRSLAFTISTKVGWQEGNKATTIIDDLFTSKNNTMSTTQNDGSTPKGHQQN